MSLGTLVAATRNPGKAREIRRLLEAEGLEVLGLDGFDDAPDVEETAETFAENARRKALACTRALGLPVIAEDAGLVVDALHGEPGVRSARFAGPDQDARANTALLLQRMKDVPAPARTARFVSALCVAGPNGVIAEAEGTTEGSITYAPDGAGGFGYDPVFLSRDLGVTFARAAPEAKNAVSHRGRALRSLLARLRKEGRLPPGRQGEEKGTP